MNQGNLNQLREAVFAERPSLEALYQSSGSLLLSEYVSTWRVGSQPLAARMRSSICTQASRIYGPVTGTAVVAQLDAEALVSTIDHHGLLCHPFFLNSNLVHSLRKQRFQVVLSTAGVSVNNSSWPSALCYHTPHGELSRVSTLSGSHRHDAVLGLARVSAAQTATLCRKLRETTTLFGAASGAADCVESSFGVPGNFSDQASQFSTSFWSAAFPLAPRVLYLPIERVVSSYLSDVLTGAAHPLTQLLTSEAGLVAVEEAFSGIDGAFGKPGKGTFLFWGMDGGRRISLARSGQRVSGGSIAVALEPEALGSALLSGTIYPSSLVCFMAVLCSGLTCLGGFNQVTWLSAVRDRTAALLRTVGDLELSAAVSGAVTENFAETNVAFLPSEHGPVRATLLDIFASGRSSELYNQFQGTASRVTLGQTIDTLLPEMYRIVVPESARTAELLAVSQRSLVGPELTSELSPEVDYAPQV